MYAYKRTTVRIYAQQISHISAKRDHMNLKQYLQSEGIKQIDFAKKLGISRRTMDFIMAGDRDIKLSTAAKIVKLTRGAVTYKDLVLPHLL